VVKAKKKNRTNIINITSKLPDEIKQIKDVNKKWIQTYKFVFHAHLIKFYHGVCTKKQSWCTKKLYHGATFTC
jgi:hypothetical protein